MRSLFWKIFLSFLGTMATILVCVVLIAFSLVAERIDDFEDMSPATALIDAARVLETEGREGLAQWLRENGELPGQVTLLAVDADGKDILGRPVPERLERRLRPRSRGDGIGPRRGGPRLSGPRVRGPDGEVFRLSLHRVPLGPFGILGVGLARGLVLIVALIVAALASYLLARYLSAPVRRLQGVTRELASGNLAARAGPSAAGRRDEIGVLARDFDAMAARLEALVKAQRELLRNITHELRSPLARITVALGLARRKRENEDADLDRIELETERLDALIGAVLRLASLDRAGRKPTPESVDLVALVDAVIHDANFEVESSGRAATRAGADALDCELDAELMHSAVENVVRNALRYTPENGAVDVHVSNDTDTAVVRVRDYGPGVADEDLGAIFEPFYRVAEARDRDSGGHGLGLAIAKACVLLHGGTITARNATGGGLEVELRLPLAGA
ncbi:MAG: ATP-binding protein [Pseudomonadota bacterium]